MVKLIITTLLTIASITPMKSFKTFLTEQNNTTQDPAYHEKFHNALKERMGDEYDIILKAAERNGIKNTDYQNLSLMYAIRRAEAGSMGREMGVLAPGAGKKPGDTATQTLDRQAGWAASTLMKNRERYAKEKPNTDFLTFFGNRWAPIGAENDPNNLNQNWIKNVTKFQQEHLQCVGPNCPKPKTKTDTEPAKPTTVSVPAPTEKTKPEEAPKKPTRTQDPRSPVIPPLGG